MKKLTKKLIVLLCALVMTISLVPTTVSAIKLGDVIGYAQPTDIVATINGYQIESYNVDGYTYICVEDLRYYGFDVQYNWDNRALYLKRDYSTNNIDPQNTNPNFWYIDNNKNVKNILYTDIGTYANGKYIQSYNINGSTIINFDELGRFGEVSYDNNAREISLYMSGVNYNYTVYAAQIYADDLEDNDYWTYRVRAKGDLVMVYAISTSYLSQAGRDEVIYDIAYDDMEYDREMLWMLREGCDVSNIYNEYRNSDGTYIYSYYVE